MACRQFRERIEEGGGKLDFNLIAWLGTVFWSEDEGEYCRLLRTVVADQLIEASRFQNQIASSDAKIFARTSSPEHPDHHFNKLSFFSLAYLSLLFTLLYRK